MGRILSGVQPTGNLHLGNYLGAIRNWVPLQNQHESLFCIVDLHSLTTQPDPAILKAHVLEMAAAYMACGVDPERSAIFPQSAVREHTELAWILSCITPLGWLNRMTQFKEKAGKQKDQANLGLYAYPVLQAADILLYKATHVPVGEDQKQHIELTRDIAGVFNNLHAQDFFPLPEPTIMKTAARIMSLRDGTKKMSKSDESDYSRIHLMDDDETIRLKIRKAKTDPDPISGSLGAMEKRPEAFNLLGIYGALSNQSIEDVMSECDGSTFAPFKSALADLLIATLSPIRARLTDLMAHPDHIQQVLNKGADKARAIASHTMKDVRSMAGLF